MNQIEALEKLVCAFRSLPGVGLKTAQRYAYKIINSDKSYAEDFSDAILQAKEKIGYCKECGDFTDKEICDICSNRNPNIICVVKEPKDVVAIEKSKSFSGVYHVLHGTISPLENRGPNDIRIKELLERIQKHSTKEVIMATNPDVEGDATAMYIAKLLKPLGVKVTRLAQGVSMGSELEYADEVTLARALEARREI
ncbi:MAG: recombination mediator RecR [Firmicutes bacterium]|nr:recombination mediator RecR [Bacillota bacterium]MDY3658893.1 recombination mediator RecR [Eubacteriales bacterium]